MLVASSPDSAMKRKGLVFFNNSAPSRTEGALQNFFSAARAALFIRDCSYTLVMMMYQLPIDMVRVLEAANEVADNIEGTRSAGGIGDQQALLGEFLGPNGYIDLNSQGVASVISGISGISAVVSRGGDVNIQPHDGLNVQDAPGIPAADMALLISAGLGLKRALPWAQVKGALIDASLSDIPDPVQAVAEGLGVPSLRTSMAPARRFVETARHMSMPAADISTALDVATSARDMGEVIAAIPEKDESKRHVRWRAAGVPQRMLQPLDRVRSNALRHASRFSPEGTPDHRERERAEEMLGTLLTEGMTISDELYSVPIETYSAHPFTVGGSGAPGAQGATSGSSAEPTEPPVSPAVMPERIEQPGGANEIR